MDKKVAGRGIQMFRCHLDPMIGPKPRNAFVPSDMGAEAWINDEASGVLIKLKDGAEHFVFAANVQSIKLKPMIMAKDLTSEDIAPIRPRLGRPPKSEAG